ncbi:hypothetical protein F3Y22_tig00110085pilonHSYRG00024 [Hibiscus syriacus]|uniref:Alpha-galactosidase n=1 Tax=Hibiscus syriacus TaxID=106335 RepID=A0A6A3BKY2_HIBSY|nr:hypothetical protein F3Y22_tig00110085pilonHSYRG00024 [Hibiscus syriacus]
MIHNPELFSQYGQLDWIESHGGHFIIRRSPTEAALNLAMGVAYYPTSPYPITYENKADAIVSTGLAGLGYKYVNLDDCWAEGERDNNGNLRAKASTFPSGIKALADYVT